MNYQLIIVIALLIVATLVVTARIVRHRTKSLLTTFVGVLVGLVVGALLSLPLASLPSPYSEVMPITVTLIAAIMFGTLFAARGTLFVSFLYQAVTGRGAAAPDAREIVVDTSAIIDGRIAEIAKTGFLFGTLLIPRVVLEELQNIADSSEPLRRGKGRRGLEVLASLEKSSGVAVEIIETPTRAKAVDAKLVQIAKQRGAAIMTTDYNLNRVAEIERVSVLNVNELANGLRPPVLPGEELIVNVVDKGREKSQGVGYLPDGTMIVVERGDKLVGQEVTTTVSRSLQTVAGKMVFVTPKGRSKPKAQSK
ncbi:PIN domain-containing protein [Patescibacteria group bacterium]|nr:PIN domain-containing protein [Patescibacteria group bacterium]